MTVATRVNRTVDAGTTWEVTVRYLNSDRTPADLTSYEASLTVHRAGNTAVFFEKGGVCDEEGYITVKVTDEETLEWTPGTYAWNLWLDWPNGDVTKPVMGRLTVRSGVDV